MGLKLFVGGLSWDTTEDAMRDFFAQVGTVTSATILTDKFTGKSKGFGFVEMSTEDEAQAAVDQLNGKELDGRTLTVNEARPQVPRENRFGGNDGGRSFNRGGGRGGDRGGDRGRQSY